MMNQSRRKPQRQEKSSRTTTSGIKDPAAMRASSISSSRIWIAMLRGVNVGGHGRMSMVELRTALSSPSFQNVQTYIQSGNIVFQLNDEDRTDDANTNNCAAAGAAVDPSVTVKSQLSLAMDNHFGWHPDVIVRSYHDFQTAVQDENPYKLHATSDPSKVHLFFLDYYCNENNNSGDDAGDKPESAAQITDVLSEAVAAMEAARAESEQFTLFHNEADNTGSGGGGGGVVYLYAPDGIGRSKLVRTLEQSLLQTGSRKKKRSSQELTVVVTGRNARTCQKLLSLANEDTMMSS
jgi:uncharacterized protein (DUF1697 family)